MLGRIKQLVYNQTIKPWKDFNNAQKVKGKPKIFIIGRNKTGTTSLHQELLKRGIIVGNQREAELLIDEYIHGNFKPIIDYCKKAQAFQDFPFSYPETYKHLHKAFPDAKFILSVRDSDEQWYNSITKFHAKKFGNGQIPGKNILQNTEYVYKGWMWKLNRVMYNTPENDVYNKEIFIKTYNEYNEEVRDYFKDSSNFLEINVASANSYKEFCDFLDLPLNGQTNFPWANKT